MTVTPADVALTLGRATPALDSIEFRQWSLWIDDVQMLLRLGDGTHEGLGALDQLDQDALDYVVRESVATLVRHPPDPARQVDVSVDDARVSRLYNDNSTAAVIRDDWWGMLRSRQGSGAFSTRPAFTPDRACW